MTTFLFHIRIWCSFEQKKKDFAWLCWCGPRILYWYFTPSIVMSIFFYSNLAHNFCIFGFVSCSFWGLKIWISMNPILQHFKWINMMTTKFQIPSSIIQQQGIFTLSYVGPPTPRGSEVPSKWNAWRHQAKGGPLWWIQLCFTRLVALGSLQLGWMQKLHDFVSISLIIKNSPKHHRWTPKGLSSNSSQSYIKGPYQFNSSLKRIYVPFNASLFVKGG